MIAPHIIAFIIKGTMFKSKFIPMMNKSISIRHNNAIPIASKNIFNFLI